MKRLHNWRTALTQTINDKRELEFKWGEHDCALWAASCVHAITGIDFAKDIRGTYTSPEGAYKQIIRVYDCHQITEIFEKCLEGKPIHVASALPGDVMFRSSNMGGFDAIVGICNGKSSLFLTEEQGLISIPTLELDGAYRV